MCWCSEHRCVCQGGAWVSVGIWLWCLSVGLGSVCGTRATCVAVPWGHVWGQGWGGQQDRQLQEAQLGSPRHTCVLGLLQAQLEAWLSPAWCWLQVPCG